MTAQPTATVPAGWTDDGLPVGLQIIGRHLDAPRAACFGGVRGGSSLEASLAADDADRHRRYMRQTRVSGTCSTLEEIG